MSIFSILLILAVVVIIYVWSLYNRLVIFKTRITASIQIIGNQLKRQANLIPNLQKATKGYLKHEKEIFTKIAEARKMVAKAVKSGNAQEMINASVKLQTALSPIRAVLESTPELKAKDVVIRLMDELRDTADKVMYAYQTLIDLTADFNATIGIFPNNLVAQVFNFQKEPGLKMPEEIKEQLKVSKEELANPKVEL